MSSPQPDDTPKIEDDEDLMDSREADYRAQPELDRYDEADIDDADISPMRFGDRRGVEAMLDERDRVKAGGQRNMIPHQLMNEEEDDIPAALQQHAQQQQHRSSFLDVSEFGSQEQHENVVNLEDFDGPLREWLDEDRVRREIQNRFRHFLTGFTDNSGNAVYPMEIKQMCQGTMSMNDVPA